MTVLLILTATSGIASLAVALWGLARRYGAQPPPATDLLIVAAHSDDCVIMAGEHALRALSCGRSVNVAYLTCGDTDRLGQRAQKRHDEAVRAWSLAGLPDSHLHFLDLPQSELGGHLRSSESELRKAQAALEALIENLPIGSSMIVPALGETHVDHQAARDVALSAWAARNRQDISVLETPEYNTYLSLLHAPEKTLLTAWMAIPLLGRLVTSSWENPESGFLGGAPGWHLPRQLNLTARKREMLRTFVSEDGALLVQLFGHRDYVRKLPDQKSRRPEIPARGLRLDGRLIAPSAVLLHGFSCCATALASACFSHLAGTLGLPRIVTLLAALGVGILAARRRLGFDRRLIWLAASIGLLIGA